MALPATAIQSPYRCLLRRIQPSWVDLNQVIESSKPPNPVKTPPKSENRHAFDAAGRQGVARRSAPTAGSQGKTDDTPTAMPLQVQPLYAPFWTTPATIRAGFLSTATTHCRRLSDSSMKLQGPLLKERPTTEWPVKGLRKNSLWGANLDPERICCGCSFPAEHRSLQSNYAPVAGGRFESWRISVNVLSNLSAKSR